MSTNALTAMEAALERAGLEVVDRQDLPGRPQKLADIPCMFADGRVGDWLRERTGGDQLWRHQASALAAAASGKNVVVTTGTGSGKSLIFQAEALRMIVENPKARVLVFYPLKALAGDQEGSWREGATAIGLDPRAVARIDGSVDLSERLSLLANSRVVIATPDICQAWLMRNLIEPEVQSFIRDLELVVIDEAHVLEGVFGSNFAYLFRRLAAARAMLRGFNGRRKTAAVKAIATSATIAGAVKHLHKLTGLEFHEIGDDLDGSPRHPRSVLHVACERGESMKAAASIHDALLDADGGGFITFVDSRQGTEQLATMGRQAELVCPYRSGYEGEDRAEIERRLRQGTLRGVISTSALELGIDIPHFSWGVNLGLPTSRRSLHQRLGRVGRARAGVFVVLAEPEAFSRFGTDLAKFLEETVEPSCLYTGNRYIQYGHARCLADELASLGRPRSVALSSVNWPEGFKDVLNCADETGDRTRTQEFEAIHQLGGDTPHINYPLRNVAEATYAITSGGAQQKIGTLTLQQAIREAYPGAVYLHQKRRYRVTGWQSTQWQNSIRVRPDRGGRQTRPIIRSFVNVASDRDGIVDGHLRRNESGFIAECHLQITERVEGYREGEEKKMYKELRLTNSGMTARSREFATTGVVLQITEPWFSESGVKKAVVAALHDYFSREYSIAVVDIDSTATNVSLVTQGQRQSVSNAIAIYDATRGSLRLTEALYLSFDSILGLLERAVRVGQGATIALDEQMVRNLRQWYDGLPSEVAGADLSVLAPKLPKPPAGFVTVYARGTKVESTRGGDGSEYVIKRPVLVEFDKPILCYQCDDGSGRYRSLPAERVAPVGGSCQYAFWNPQTTEMRAVG